MTEITEEQIIWFPGIYGGRTDPDYTQKVADLAETTLISLVQRRAKEDGEWAIKGGHVGDNEDNMRKMMEFVSDEINIKQARTHALKEAEEGGAERTVDWICRDLANASKFAHGTSG